MYLGFQCFSADTITNFCFASSFNQLSFPDFRGDIVVGVDNAMSTLTLRKFSIVFVWLVHNFPYSLLARISPALRGLITFRTVSQQPHSFISVSRSPNSRYQALKNQIDTILQNPQVMDDAPHRIIYRELLNPATIKGHSVPTAEQLMNEAEVLFSAGSHTVGTVLMAGVYHLLRTPETKQRLVNEIRSAWPVLDKPPSYEELERLPFLASIPFVWLRRPFLNLGSRLRSSKRCYESPLPSLLVFRVLYHHQAL